MASAVAAVALSLVPLSSRHVYVKVAFGATGKAPIVMSQRGSSTRPTHFLSFRLPNADLHAKVAEAQKMIILREPDAVGCDVEPVKSHLTLFVLSLGNHEAMQAATKALRSCASFAIDSNLLTPPRVHLEGLGNFGQRVCFVPVAETTGPDAEDLARVRRLVARVAKVFCKAGLVDEAVVDGADAKGWTPHLTLLKTSKRPAGKGRGRGGKSGRGHASRPCIRPAMYADLLRLMDFGVHELHELQLCSMSGVAEDGYYPVLESISLDGRQSSSNRGGSEWTVSPCFTTF